MIDWINNHEPLWLFVILAMETVLSSVMLLYIIKEYYYDYNKDRRRPTRRTRKHKVVVTVEDGQATITEQPKDVEVILENK